MKKGSLLPFGSGFLNLFFSSKLCDIRSFHFSVLNIR